MVDTAATRCVSGVSRRRHRLDQMVLRAYAQSELDHSMSRRIDTSVADMDLYSERDAAPCRPTRGVPGNDSSVPVGAVRDGGESFAQRPRRSKRSALSKSVKTFVRALKGTKSSAGSLTSGDKARGGVFSHELDTRASSLSPSAPIVSNVETPRTRIRVHDDDADSSTRTRSSSLGGAAHFDSVARAHTSLVNVVLHESTATHARTNSTSMLEVRRRNLENGDRRSAAAHISDFISDSPARTRSPSLESANFDSDDDDDSSKGAELYPDLNLDLTLIFQRERLTNSYLCLSTDVISFILQFVRVTEVCAVARVSKYFGQVAKLALERKRTVLCPRRFSHRIFEFVKRCPRAQQIVDDRRTPTQAAISVAKVRTSVHHISYVLCIPSSVCTDEALFAW